MSPYLDCPVAVTPVGLFKIRGTCALSTPVVLTLKHDHRFLESFLKHRFLPLPLPSLLLSFWFRKSEMGPEKLCFWRVPRWCRSGWAQDHTLRTRAPAKLSQHLCTVRLRIPRTSHEQQGQEPLGAPLPTYKKCNAVLSSLDASCLLWHRDAKGKEHRGREEYGDTKDQLNHKLDVQPYRESEMSPACVAFCRHLLMFSSTPPQNEYLGRLLDLLKPLLFTLGNTFKSRSKILKTLMPGSFPGTHV